jgi:hypothetical protein
MAFALQRSGFYLPVDGSFRDTVGGNMPLPTHDNRKRPTDVGEQIRNIARQMTAEIGAATEFYANR